MIPIRRSPRCGASLGLALACLLLLSGCATVPKDPVAREEYRANRDPLEPLNRRFFAFNQQVDRFLLKPLAKDYVRIFPAPVRDALRNFLNNLDEPVILGNNLLQARWRRAGKTTARFAANSTLGLAGLRDWATPRGLPRQIGDFGQTLDRWGVGEGPYLVLPLFGPSNPRDGIGSGVDIFLDPLRYVTRANHYPTSLTVGRQVLAGIDERSRNLGTLDEVQRGAIDYYASLRSLVRQNRDAQLHQGALVPKAVPDSFYEDPGAPAPAPASH